MAKPAPSVASTARRMRAFGFGIMAIAPALGAHAQPVTTYHNTRLRSGWDKAETSLTVANVGGGEHE